MYDEMNYMFQGKNIIFVVDGETHEVNELHLNYKEIMESLKEEDFDQILNYLNPEKEILNYGEGRIAIKGDILYWDDEEMHNSLADRIIEMYRQGFPLKPFVLFMENLMNNPSYRAVNELYKFLDGNNLPISKDGEFFAYKKVRDDYTDCYTGTIDNSIGQVVTMERNFVDDNKERTCSKGLHFCSKEYLESFGGQRLMILKINPRDVVSIPIDYGFSKGRCCRYEVVDEIEMNEADDAFAEIVL